MSNPLNRLRLAFADQYAIEHELGRGGMATVYLAKDLKHNRKVAVKVLRPELAAALGAERFLREVQITARLQHPHILTLIDSGVQDGFLYYVMPFVEGESLRDRLNREHQLPLDDALRITREAADALGYAHSRDVIHRDIKPENILLSGGHAIVADFGIARAISAARGGDLTATGLSIGTPAYMSPEQATGSKQLDGRTDIYSLGCVLYEMLVGDPPFTGATAQAIFARTLVDPPPRIRTVRQTVPSSVEQAVTKALAKIPADRFPTATQFAEALHALDGTPSVMEGRRWRRVAFLLVGLLLLAGAGVATWRAFGDSGRASSASAVRTLLHQRVAVRYFQDLTSAHDLGYVADGLTEALIDSLRRVPGLEVISQSGTSQFRDPRIPRDSIARALNVTTLVEGSVESIAGSLHVSTWVVDAASGMATEHRAIDGSPGEVLDLSKRLAQEVLRLLAEKPGGRASAWMFVQQASQVRKDAEGLLQTDSATAVTRLGTADSLLALAAANDPKWIEPIVQRGQVAYKLSRRTTNFVVDSPWINKGLAFAERALELDSKYPRALELRGTLHYWKWLLHGVPDSAPAAALLRDAERDLRAAIQFDSLLATAWSTLSHLDYQKSDVVAANHDARRAEEVDPYFANSDRVVWRLFTSSYDLELIKDAVHWCEVGQNRYPSNVQFTECQLWLLTMKGIAPDVPKAWRLVDQLKKITTKGDWPLERLESQITVAAVLARAGLADSARGVLSRSRGDSMSDPAGDLIYREAFVRTLLGDRAEAIHLLERYTAGHPERLSDIAKDYQWWFRDLRADPRYQLLIGGAH